MQNETPCRVRYGEAFWQALHTAWQQSALNQREYCEAHDIPLKAFGSWRAKFKPNRSLLSPSWSTAVAGLSHGLSHGLIRQLYRRLFVFVLVFVTIVYPINVRLSKFIFASAGGLP